MTELWLVRHGQTDWNVVRRFQGNSDTCLNDTGIAQAQTLAAALDGQSFAALYASPLRRAFQTAEALAERLQLSIQVDEDLVEACHGDWEGMLWSDIKDQYPELMAQRSLDPVNTRPPGDGETVAEVAVRMTAAAARIAQRHPQEKVLIASHGLSLAALICCARGVSLHEIFDYIPKNTQVEKITWDAATAPCLETKP
ncbi:MAG: histidine phosphatase family protein [Anaerolineaceae bacterium]|nr:histidine phosphatase family protein [Anaerolineaceae bacterium]